MTPRCLRKVLYASVLATLLLTAPSISIAEIYRDIGPLDILNDVKAKFPNAKFEKGNPAWAQATDVMYAITGIGISGTIFIKFDDFRPSYRKHLDNCINEQNRRTALKDMERNNPEVKEGNPIPEIPVEIDPKISKLTDDALNDRISLYQFYINQSDDEALSVAWVRWLPDIPIPLQRFITKYGNPDVSGFSDEDMTPYRYWNRGILTSLTDDGKKVSMVDYYFTEKDEYIALCKKHPHLCKKTAPKKSPAPAKTPAKKK